MLWMVLLVLAAVGAGAAVGLAVRDRRRSLPSGGGNQPSLPAAAAADRLLERTIRDLRTGDILTMDGRDFVVEGVVHYDEDGHRWVGGRAVDGNDVKWVVVGIERSGTALIRLLVTEDPTPLGGYPPETMILGDTRFALDKRGTATCKLDGELGGLGGSSAGKTSAHVTRCRWWLYSAPGTATLLVEQWGDDYRMLRGNKVVDGIIEMMPGS